MSLGQAGSRRSGGEEGVVEAGGEGLAVAEGVVFEGVNVVARIADEACAQIAGVAVAEEDVLPAAPMVGTVEAGGGLVEGRRGYLGLVRIPGGGRPARKLYGPDR